MSKEAFWFVIPSLMPGYLHLRSHSLVTHVIISISVDSESFRFYRLPFWRFENYDLFQSGVSRTASFIFSSDRAC